MKKHLSIIPFFLISIFGFSQVGINTTVPNAQLDIQSSNQAIPTNTDGILIPKVDAFPAINPTFAQQGMMVFLTTLSGTNQPGFYYWNNPTITWLPVGNNNSAWKLTGNAGTNATNNFVGTTDNVDLVFKRFNSQAGKITSTNTFFGNLSGNANTLFDNTFIGAEAGRDNISGGQNVFIGRRAGANGMNGSNNVLIGNGAGIFNSANQNVFVGSFSGNGNTTGTNNSFLGYFSGANNGTGSLNTYLGASTGSLNTFGTGNTFVGFNSNASSSTLSNATAIGINSQVGTSNSMILGSINGVNGATTSTNIGVGTTSPNGVLDITSNKNGVLIPRIALTSATAALPVVNPQGGLLDTSTLIYNIATSGASPNNVYPGFYYWNGTKWIRFDVNGENNPTYYSVVGTTNDFTTNAFTLLDQMSITFTPKDNVALINFSAAGYRNDDSFINSALFFQILLNGVPVTGWQTATNQSIVNVGTFFTDDVTTWETNISYPINVPIGISQTIQIQWSLPYGQIFNNPSLPFTAFGSVFKSYRTLTVIDPNGGGGIVGSPPVTTNMWAQNGNAGTIAGTNFVGTADFQPLVLKSNNIEGLRVATNGNIGIKTVTPLDELHITGNIRMVDGNQAAGKVLTSDANGTATWQNTTANAWGLVGNANTNSSNNFIGTLDNTDLTFRTNSQESLRIKNDGRIEIGNNNILSTYSASVSQNPKLIVASNSADNNIIFQASNNLNDPTSLYFGMSAGINSLPIAITNNTNLGNIFFSGYNGSSFIASSGIKATVDGTVSSTSMPGRLDFLTTPDGSNTIATRMSIKNDGNIGIGTNNPIRKLHLFTGTSGATPNGNSDFVLESNGPIYQHFLAPSTAETGTLFGSNLGSIRGGLLFNNATETLQFRSGGNTNRMIITSAGDVGIGTPTPGGQFELSLNEGRKPGSTTWTIVSDKRLKTINGNYTKGLNEILQLNPIRFNYKNAGERKFEQKVLDTEFAGFIAQEVQPLFPDAVGIDADGFLNFNIHPILIASINAIKELNEKNEDLKNEIEILKEKIINQNKINQDILERLSKLESKY
ncbi:tail fiber domain-containing protein [Flavobacterium sp. SUN052]|uniref:tail fiber domain-containing protein n=1 Tax=Flavobacterium sp. SUN052 TaxID=3002441 RepID=UPI00237DF5EC|nr:tail fiber domain-containing protein [Flavobacterium sp. SUN052]MEC4004121.1 tail fiber domain-containing protein [Flavobacterium sp. SUN052]